MNSVGGYDAKISAPLKGHSLANAIPKIPLRKLLMKSIFVMILVISKYLIITLCR